MLTINWAVVALACGFMLMDIITGFTQACVNKVVDSQVMKMGLLHKCGFLLAIVFGFMCEASMYYIDLGFTMPVGSAVCAYVILTEIMSNLENLAKISPELSEQKFMEIFKHDAKLKK